MDDRTGPSTDDKKKNVLTDERTVSRLRNERHDDKQEGKGHHGEDMLSRRGAESRASSEFDTLMAHALGEIVSDHILAGPHGALYSEGGRTMTQRTMRGSLYSLSLRLSRWDGLSIPMNIEDAIEETGHGCFQYKLMALCGFIYACCSLSTTTLSFVLPAAQYDFSLDSVDKGVLNTAPLWGMVFGAYLWGSVADSKGRKFVLFCSLMIDAIAAFLSSLCQSYHLFFTCRIFNGFGIIGATSIVFAYLGEFLDHSYRDRYLSRLELFWTLGIVALPVIGIAILPRNWEIGNSDTFVFNSWRIFVFTCGIPSFTAALLMLRMPESPRFLYLQSQYDKSLKVLKRMYISNTSKGRRSFPVTVLEEDQDTNEYYFAHSSGDSTWKKIKTTLKGVMKQHKDLLRGRSLINFVITCTVDFGLMSVYFTFMLWVPELLHRQEVYLNHFPNGSAPLCAVNAAEIEMQDKNAKVDYFTLIHTLIICTACFPSNLILLWLINYVSKKALIVCLMCGASIPTFALYYMDSEFKVTTMLCLFEAISTLIEAVLFCAIVEIFPLSTRGSALSLTVTVGRFGAVLGNIVFGATLDHHCMYLFFGMGSILVICGLLALFLPAMRIGH